MTLIAALSLLIAADFALTATAVGRMGATELNPLCDICGGLYGVVVLAGVVEIAGVIT